MDLVESPLKLFGFLFSAAIVVTISGHFWFEIRKKLFDPFNLKNFFLIYFIIIFGVYGVILPFREGAGIGGMGIDLIYTSNHFYYFEASLLSFCCLALFFFGYAVGPKIKTSANNEESSQGQSAKSLAFLNPVSVAAILIPIQWIASYLFFDKMGGMMAFVLSLEASRNSASSANGPYDLFMSLLPLLGYLYYLNVRGFKGPNVTHLYWKTTLFIVLLIPLAMRGFRVSLVPYFLQFVALYNYQVKKLNLRKIAVVSTVLIAIIGAYGTVRATLSEAVLQQEFSWEQVADTTIFRLPGTEMVMTVLKEYDQRQIPHYGFDGLIETLTILIPREIWPGKPDPNSFAFGEIFFKDYFLYTQNSFSGDYGGISPSVVGDFYWRYGLIGTLFVFFLLGLVFKWFYARFTKNPQKRLFIYSLVASYSAIIAESPQGAANAIFMSTVFALLFTIFVRSSSEEPIDIRGQKRFLFTEANS